MATYLCLHLYTMTWKSLKNCFWSLGNAKANMSWSHAHHDTVCGNDLISSPAALPHSAQREQLVNIVFYCHHSVDDSVISLLHIILIPSLGKNYHPACLYIGLFEYIQDLWSSTCCRGSLRGIWPGKGYKRVFFYPVFLSNFPSPLA